jgi:hypothetical protein
VVEDKVDICKDKIHGWLSGKISDITYLSPEMSSFLVSGGEFGAGFAFYALKLQGKNKMLQDAKKVGVANRKLVTREKRWIQLADEGKLPKQVTETIRRTVGKGIRDIHGLELAHLPGKPAYRGFDYSDALPKTTSIHRGSHHRFYKDLPNGGIQVRHVPKPENVFSQPKGGVFKRLDEIEKAIKK